MCYSTRKLKYCPIKVNEIVTNYYSESESMKQTCRDHQHEWELAPFFGIAKKHYICIWCEAEMTEEETNEPEKLQEIELPFDEDGHLAFTTNNHAFPTADMIKWMMRLTDAVNQLVKERQ